LWEQSAEEGRGQIGRCYISDSSREGKIYCAGVFDLVAEESSYEINFVFGNSLLERGVGRL